MMANHGLGRLPQLRGFGADPNSPEPANSAAERIAQHSCASLEDDSGGTVGSEVIVDQAVGYGAP